MTNFPIQTLVVQNLTTSKTE